MKRALVVLMLASCAHAASPPAPACGESVAQRIDACVSIYNRVTDLVAAPFFAEHPEMGASERKQYRARLVEALKSSGAAEEFRQHCVVEASASEIRCLEIAASLEAMSVCGKL
jgi:hypothetical protein